MFLTISMMKRRVMNNRLLHNATPAQLIKQTRILKENLWQHFQFAQQALAKSRGKEVKEHFGE